MIKQLEQSFLRFITSDSAYFFATVVASRGIVCVRLLQARRRRSTWSDVADIAGQRVCAAVAEDDGCGVRRTGANSAAQARQAQASVRAPRKQSHEGSCTTEAFEGSFV